MAGGRRPAARAHPAPRRARQLLGHGHPRPRRAVLGDLLRPRSRARARGRPGGRRGPLRRDLEPRLHAGHPRGGQPEVRGRPHRGAAAEEHRHRPRRRARRVPAPGRGERLRDRPAAPGDRPRRRSSRAAPTTRAPRSRASGSGSSPTTSAPAPCSSATASCPATRAAATCCAACCAASCATPGCSAITEPVLVDLAGVVRDAMGPSYPEIVTSYERIAAVVRREEEAFLATLATGSRIFESAVSDVRASGSTTLPGLERLRPARHLRLPHRPDAGDGLGGRALGRRGRLPLADGRAAVPRQGRRRRPQARRGRRQRLPRGPGARPGSPTSSATPTSAPTPRSSG